MQDIPVASTKTTDQTALLTNPTWDTTTVDTTAFSNLLAYESNVAHNETPLPATPEPSARLSDQDAQDHSKRASVEIKNRAQEADSIKETAVNAEQAAPVDLEDAPEMVKADHTLKEMQDVQVDAESFQGMRPQLKRYGISDEDIATLERKINSEQGMTWGQLVSFISKNMNTAAKTVDLTTDQQQKLMTFFQKLGFSAPESKRMLADLENGNAAQISQTVQKQLTTLPQDKLASLDKDELDAFNDLLKKFQGQLKAEDRALVRVVGKAMENAMDKARRMAQEQAANKQVEAGKTPGVKTIAETATKVDTDISKAAVFSDESPVAEQARNQAKDAEKLVKTLSTEDQLKARVNQTEGSIAKGAKLAEHKDTDAFLQQDKGSEDKAWNEFFEKLQLDESGKGTALKLDTTKGFAEAVSLAKTAARTASGPATRTEAPHVVKQVESAILKTLSGGAKRLTLQLTPEHLGSLNVALTVKNSEVSATIRADSMEAGKMIAEQLESIRQNLEEQGLKVNKLEVQTQLQGNADQGSWQGLASQEHGFQQGMWSRLRSEMNGNGGSGEFTAEQMSEMAREAILSENGNGLHVVA